MPISAAGAFLQPVSTGFLQVGRYFNACRASGLAGLSLSEDAFHDLYAERNKQLFNIGKLDRGQRRRLKYRAEYFPLLSIHSLMLALFAIIRQ